MSGWPPAPEGLKIWRLLNLATGGYSREWWPTEDEAQIACANTNAPGRNRNADVWIVISDEPAP